MMMMMIMIYGLAIYFIKVVVNTVEEKFWQDADERLLRVRAGAGQRSRW